MQHLWKILGAAAFVALAMFLSSEVVRTRRAAERALDRISLAPIGATTTEVEIMQTTQVYRATWTDTTGVVQEVVTPRLEDEPVGAWAARHKEAVNALKAEFPPAQ